MSDQIIDGAGSKVDLYIGTDEHEQADKHGPQAQCQLSWPAGRRCSFCYQASTWGRYGRVAHSASLVGRFLDELSKSNAFALPIADEGSGDWWASTRTSSSPNYRGDCGTRRRPAPIDVCGCSGMQLQPMEKTDSAGIDDIGAGKARQDTRML